MIAGLGVFVLLIAGAGWFFDALVINLYAVSVPKIEESLHASTTTIGLIATIFLVGYAGGTFAGGLMSDYIGRKKGLGISILGYTVTTALTGLASSPAMLGIARALTGLGGGMELPVATTYLAETWPEKSRGRGFGMFYSFYSLGSLAAVGFFGLFLNVAEGWRYAFLLCLLPGLLIVFVRQFLVETPRFQTVQQRFAGEKRKTTIRQLFAGKSSRRALIGTTIAWIGTEYTYWSYSVYLPLYLMQKGHLSPGRMTGAMALIYLLAIVFVVGSGWLGDRLGRRNATILTAVAGAVAMYFFTSRRVDSLPLLIVLGFLVFGIYQGPWVNGILYCGESFPTEMRGTATSFSLTVGRVGALFAPLVAGILIKYYSIPVAFRLGSLMFLLSIAGVLIAGEPKRQLADFCEEQAGGGAVVAQSS
ncbi:MAG: MFS transporter [Peptococcaceae bacterium]|nr:MFS transporter [Peptococcaceae bacterium]